MADTYTILTQIKSALSSSLPGKLSTVTSSAGVSLDVPVDYIISKDVDDKAELPNVAIYAEATENEDWLSPLRQLTIPLVIECRFRIGKADRETAYHYGYLYSRALDNALVSSITSTDAYHVNVTSDGVDVGSGDNRYKATAVLEANVFVEQSRDVA